MKLFVILFMLALASPIYLLLVILGFAKLA